VPTQEIARERSNNVIVGRTKGATAACQWLSPMGNHVTSATRVTRRALVRPADHGYDVSVSPVAAAEHPQRPERDNREGAEDEGERNDDPEDLHDASLRLLRIV
jgi:hypothetical protein